MDDLKSRIAEVERASAEISKGRKPKFGDRMRNPWAGESNPHRDGFFVKATRRTGKVNPGLWYQMTDGKGDFWESDGKVMFFLDALKEPPMNWIKCSERMPKHKQRVIIASESGVAPGYYDDGRYLKKQVGKWYSGNRILGEGVTHWMPLPQPPQQEVKSALEIGMSRYEGAMQKLAEGGD